MGAEFDENHPRDASGRFSGVSLREFLERIFDERWRAHVEQHRAEQKAIDLASVLVAQNKEDANEWRGLHVDQDRTFAKSTELQSLELRLRGVEVANERRDQTERDRLVTEAQEGKREERRQFSERSRQTINVAVISIIVSATVGIALHFVK